MNLRRRHRVQPEVATASLNDIMFFLMLFFLIASTLVNPNVIKLLLPKASKNQTTINKQPLTISVTADLHYFINNREVMYDNLQQELANSIVGTTEPTAVLRVDKEVTVQELVTLLDIGNKLKIKMILATDTKK
ncbi:MAG: biopolymer transporter ExbD [Bacteroidota bacterium]